jgi:WD40 repeat protein
MYILGNCEITFEGHTNFIFSVIQLKDGRICSGGRDGKIKLWTLNGKHVIIYIS